MNDFDDLDDVFGPLRSAATDAELAGETLHVDAMARHHRRQKGHIMFSSRRARVATFVAAGVIGFGGIAAAASPAGPFALTDSDGTSTTSEAPTTTSEAPTTTSEVPPTTSEVTTTTSEAPDEIVDDGAMITRTMIEQTTDDADDGTHDDDPDTDFDEGDCLDGNHGKTVSAAARGEEGFEDVEQRVVAQSSCGKDDAEGSDADASDDADDQAEVEVKDDDDSDDSDSDTDEVDVDDDSDDDDSDDDDSDDGRPEKSGRPESPGSQGNGSKKKGGD
jgi:hypothetical protein